ncbi:MAG: cell division protein FtsA [Acidobacteria bacterium RIFCSPLOWO2_02_FULL_61_28]|nr:MAG: cell division protein FtsA [Acidobacteria bacterium RIFCSPLOWO2_02_FULL_61_28]
MNQERDYLAALDLGSTMTRALFAEVLDSGEEDPQVRFLGFGESESLGWRKGVVADLDAVAGSVKKALEQAEAAAGVSIESAVVGIGGPHIQGISSRAGLPLAARPREVTRDDVRRVMESARSVPLPKGREILHMLPQEFALDSQSGVRDPIGMQAGSLAVKVHLITGSQAASQSVVAAVNRAGVVVETVVAEAFAVGEAVLTPEERELGVLVVVLGGGSAELAAYYQGGLRMSSGIAIGGDHFTSDVAIGLHTPSPEAEIIKKMFGSVYSGWSHDGASFEVPGLANRPSRMVPRRDLLEILEPRAQELLAMAIEELRQADLEPRLGAGVIFAGGGARLHGLCDLAENVFSGPARLGLPSDVWDEEGVPAMILDSPRSWDGPEYTTVGALLLYGLRLRRLRMARRRTPAKRWKSLLAGKAREGVR